MNSLSMQRKTMTLAMDISNVTSILAKGAEVNAKDALGQTALIYAATYGNEEIVRVLAAKGAI